jgi:toxin ParE1/3/4
MMHSVTILSEAEAELWQAIDYYEQKAPGLGLDFGDEVERVVQAIRQFPERWPLRDDGTRRQLTDRFPFVVVYTFLNNHIWVLAFAHCKRRPGYWADRIYTI